MRRGTDTLQHLADNNGMDGKLYGSPDSVAPKPKRKELRILFIGKTTSIRIKRAVQLCCTALFFCPVFTRRYTEGRDEVSVKASQRIISAFQSTPYYWIVRVVQKIAGITYSALFDVRFEGYSR